MIHRIEGDWALKDREGRFVLPMKPVVFDYIVNNNLSAILLPLHSVADRGGVIERSTRYETADTSFPMIVSKMENPFGLEYRMIDGRHRKHKLVKQGLTFGWFYEIPRDFVINNIVEIK